MISKQGQTLSFIGLSEGHMAKTSGVYKGATTFYCLVAGSLTFKYNNADSSRNETVDFTAGREFGVKNLESAEIVTGTFDIGFD